MLDSHTLASPQTPGPDGPLSYVIVLERAFRLLAAASGRRSAVGLLLVAGDGSLFPSPCRTGSARHAPIPCDAQALQDAGEVAKGMVCLLLLCTYVL